MSKSKNRIKKAMQHPNILGAGAKKREKLTPTERETAVLKEFSRGTLHSGSGDIVHNRKQAIAIAISEANKKRKR